MDYRNFVRLEQQVVSTEAGLAATIFHPAARRWGNVSLDSPFHGTSKWIITGLAIAQTASHRADPALKCLADGVTYSEHNATDDS
jgi:hypothetical protein